MRIFIFSINMAAFFYQKLLKIYENFMHADRPSIPEQV